MIDNLSYNPWPQYIDLSGKAAARGQLRYYEVGTMIPKDVYADPNLTTPLGPVINLDINGLVPPSGVWLGYGNYTMYLYQADTPEDPFTNYTQVREIDVLIGKQSPSSADSLAIVNAVTSIVDVDFNITPYANCLGYYQVADQGGGWWYWAAASMAPIDYGTVMPSNLSSTGRWLRIMSEGYVSIAMFGCMPNKGVDMSSRMSACASAANARNMPMVHNGWSVQASANLTISQPISVVLQPGFKLVKLSDASLLTYTLTVATVTINGSQSFGNLVLTTNIPMEVDPINWGADPYADSFHAFQIMAAGNVIPVLNRVYPIDGSLSGLPYPALSIPRIHVMKGGAIVNGFTTGLLTIMNATVDSDATYWIRSSTGTLSNWSLRQSLTYGWVYNGTSPTAAMINGLYTISTDRYINWNTPNSTITIPVGAFTGLINVSKINTFGNGCQIKLTENVGMGIIDAGRYRIFTAGYGVPTGLSQPVYPEWFGASTIASAAVNRAALQSASDTAARSNGILDGGGAAYSTDTHITPAAGTITFSNITISCTGSVAIYISEGELAVINSRINGAIICYSKIASISFEGSTNYISSSPTQLIAGTVTLSNSKFTGDGETSLFQVGTAADVPSYSSSVGSTYDSVLVQVYGPGVWSSNTHRQSFATVGKSLNKFWDPSRMVITNNTFRVTCPLSGVYVQLQCNVIMLSGIAAGYTVNSLVTTGNSFYITNTEIPKQGVMYLVNVANMANSGHNAMIKDNVCNRGASWSGGSSVDIVLLQTQQTIVAPATGIKGCLPKYSDKILWGISGWGYSNYTVNNGVVTYDAIGGSTVNGFAVLSGSTEYSYF